MGLGLENLEVDLSVLIFFFVLLMDGVVGFEVVKVDLHSALRFVYS